MTQAERVPATQYAVQLVGPGQLVLNTQKEVPEPGPHEILARVESVGLCFSDVKLLKQFADHPRKDEIRAGISPEILQKCRSYVPGTKAAVPGHEVACRIVAVGTEVQRHHVGERCLVQTDYRTLVTRGANAAFGYTFEGGLQEYVLMDERVVIEPGTGERYLIPVPESLSASAVALVEPWSCVENAYASADRRTVMAGGRLLVVADAGHGVTGLTEAFDERGGPASVVAVTVEGAQREYLRSAGLPVNLVDDVGQLPDESFDDIVYFGSCPETIEALNDKLAASGVINIVLGGSSIGRRVAIGIGRIHYGHTRWVGTTGRSAVVSYSAVPASGELRPHDRILIVGAAGPMGQMHVIRSLCTPVEGISVVGADVDDARLAALGRKAEPYSRRNGVPLRLVNTAKEPLDERFSYQVVLVPAGPLVAAAVDNSETGGLVDIFAGIPAHTRQEIDLDTYIARRCYMFGTSGSVISDMKVLLDKVSSGQLDTNCSVDAVSGMAGAIDGVAALERQTMAGKIVIYPMLHDVGLTRLAELADRFPTVASKLDGGQWTKEAEQELLRTATGPVATGPGGGRQ
jgi:D-arabinose 1-dehydrogenase-like Zn-dependent alcohol dehydrogenase